MFNSGEEGMLKQVLLYSQREIMFSNSGKLSWHNMARGNTRILSLTGGITCDFNSLF